MGGALAAKLISSYKLKSIDLLIVSSAILILLSIFSYFANQRGFYEEVKRKDNKDVLVIQTRWNELLKSRYFWGILLVIFFSQMIEPLVEYIFLNTIEKEVQGLDQRTAMISSFFSILGTASLLINIFITPLILKFFGVIGGLIVQPLSIIFGSIWFSLQGSLNSALALKISDRGLSYSINRAAKEMLYLPLNPSIIYRTKAWLDMFGYRLFKLASSLLILCFTDWKIFSVGKNDLSYLLIAICFFWIATIAMLSREYSKLDKA